MSAIMKKNEPSHHYMAKIIIIGNSSVGKTSIVQRYTWNGIGEYQLCHTPTIGLDFKTKTVKSKDKLIKLQIWDTAGQQRFRNMTDSYYHGVSAIILTYSVEDRKSFEDINQWMYQITKNADENVPKIVVANKCQLGLTEGNGQKRMVEAHQGRIAAEKYKAKFLQVSAKENINIQQIFLTLTTQIMKGIQKNKQSSEGGQSNILLCKKEKPKLQQQFQQNKKNCCQ